MRIGIDHSKTSIHHVSPPGLFKPLGFHKMHANGDDFVVVDSRTSPTPITSNLARRLGDRNRGIGFNQIAVMLDCDDADARLMFWNADGSSLDACGSATRGAADILMRESDLSSVALRTNRGLLTCERTSTGAISVNMGKPLFSWSDIPLALEMDTSVLPLAGDLTACSIGNPHCTYFVDDLPAVEIATIGPAIETNPLFPLRTNVHFVQIIDREQSGCVFGSAEGAFRWVQVLALVALRLMEFVVAF